MRQFLPYILCIILAGLFLWSLFWNKETTLEKQLLQREIKAIENRLIQKDSIIELSEKRELALLGQYRRLQASADSTELIAINSIKLYQEEKRKRRTAILEQTQYDSALLVLYPERHN